MKYIEIKSEGYTYRYDFEPVGAFLVRLFYIAKFAIYKSTCKGAIESISQQLQKELPGLRGFSATNIKNMRSFYEEWSPVISRQPMAYENKTLTAVSDLELNEQMLLMEIRQPMADEKRKTLILLFSPAFILKIQKNTPNLDFWVYKRV